MNARTDYNHYGLSSDYRKTGLSDDFWGSELRLPLRQLVDYIRSREL